MAKKYLKELIGQELNVIDSKNKSNLHLKGKVVDETKYTIKIKQQGKIKTLLKKNITFKVGDILIDGKNITKRPEERTK